MILTTSYIVSFRVPEEYNLMDQWLKENKNSLLEWKRSATTNIVSYRLTKTIHITGTEYQAVNVDD